MLTKIDFYFFFKFLSKFVIETHNLRLKMAVKTQNCSSQHTTGKKRMSSGNILPQPNKFTQAVLGTLMKFFLSCLKTKLYIYIIPNTK